MPRYEVLQSYIVRVGADPLARPLRLEFPGAVYHVTSRGNARQNIVADDQDWLQLVSLGNKKGVLYLGSENWQGMVDDQPGVRDRWGQGLRRPWVSKGPHIPHLQSPNSCVGRTKGLAP